MSAAPVITSGALMLLEEDHALNFQSYAADAVAARTILDKLLALGPVKSTADMHERVEVSSKIAIALKGLEDTREKAVGPLNKQVREINAMFAEVRVPAEEAVATVKRHKSAWDQQEIARERREREELERQKREAAEAEERARAKAESARTAKAREKALAEAAAASAEQAAVEAEMVRPAALGIKGDFGGMSSRKVWVAEVVRPDLVPREYLVVDEALIRAAVKAGVRVIAGVNITQENQQAQRVRG